MECLAGGSDLGAGKRLCGLELCTGGIERLACGIHILCTPMHLSSYLMLPAVLYRFVHCSEVTVYVGIHARVSPPSRHLFDQDMFWCLR